MDRWLARDSGGVCSRASLVSGGLREGDIGVWRRRKRDDDGNLVSGYRKEIQANDRSHEDFLGLVC